MCFEEFAFVYGELEVHLNVFFASTVDEGYLQQL